MGFHICDQGRYSVLQLLILIVRTCAFQILFPKFSLYKKLQNTEKDENPSTVWTPHGHCLSCCDRVQTDKEHLWDRCAAQCQ